jgi:hypothetical protein
VTTDISFVSTVRGDAEFQETVHQQVSDMRKHLRSLDSDERPTFAFKELSQEVAIYNQVVSTKKIIHFAAHGNYFKKFQISKEPEIERLFKVDSFIDKLVREDSYLNTPVVILDACNALGLLWRLEFSKIVGPGKKMVLIGSPHGIPYDQAVQFFDFFYQDLLSRKLPSNASLVQRRVSDSFRVAQDEYRRENRRTSKMRITTLIG